MEKKTKEGKQEEVPAKNSLLELIKDFINILWAEFIKLNIDNLSYCLECDLLDDDINKYKEKMQSAFIDMVNVEYKIRITSSKLPITDIERCLSGKRKLSSFSMRIMKKIVASYLSIYQYDPKDKERVCTLLGFDYKRLFLEDQKKMMFGEE